MTVVITGASSGIGEALAYRYAALSSRLYLIARREDVLQSLAFKLRRDGLEVFIFAVDVSDFSALRDVCEKICKECKRVDIVIANAGVSSEHSATMYDFWDFKRTIDTNFLGTVAVFDIFAKKMLEQKDGKLVAISSLASFVALPTTAAYSASKRAVNSFLDSMRLLLHGNGVSVINIQPGFIKTPLTDKNRFKMPFLMSLNDGVDKIFDAIQSGKKEFAFPFFFGFGAKFISKLPVSIRDVIVRRVAKYEEHPPKRS